MKVISLDAIGSKVLTACLVCLLLPVSFTSLELLASDNPVGAGAVLRSGFGARALGMGGAYVAIADDYSAPYWNPAGVTRSNSLYLGGMSYDKYGLGLNTNYLSGGFNWTETTPEGLPIPALDLPLIKGVSFAGTYLGFSTQVWTRGPGGSEIEITYGERSFLATGGLTFPLIGSFGFSGKRYSFTAPKAGVDEMDASASGVGFDLGYLAEPLENFTFGAAAFDLNGTGIQWTNTPTEPTDIVPVRYSIGSAYRFHLDHESIPEFISGRLLVSGQYTFGPDVRNRIRTGCEYHFSIFSLRAGTVRPAENPLYFTAGAGLKVNYLTGDLAWIQNNSIQGENTTDTVVFSTEFEF